MPDNAADKGSEAILETGRKVGELAKGLFGDYDDVVYDNDIDMRIEKTQNLLKDCPNVITEASFSHDDNFCSVDILKNDADGVEIYEVKSSTEIKDIYLDDVAYQYFVLTSAGLNVKKAAIVYINNEYVRGSELDMAQLFNIEDVTDIVSQKQDEIKSIISAFNDLGQSEPEIDIGQQCFNPYPCPYWQYCTRNLPTPNVFDIAVMQRRSKFKKYYDGKISFEDLEN